jgi:hypothetical protein
MPYTLLKFLHVGSMFLATALAIGPSVLLYLVGRSGSADTIRRTFAHSSRVFRASGALYGLGLLLGFVTAVNGSLNLTTPWLVGAYILVVLLIAVNFTFERWTHRVEAALEDETGSRLAEATGSRVPVYALAGMTAVTLLLVFVMVVKPTF